MLEPVLFKNRQPDRPATLDEYCATGGYSALRAALAKYSPREVSRMVQDAELRGRGGAAFPTGHKWLGIRDTAAFPRYIVVNADEMEPGTFKDRVLLDTDPHMVIEGAVLAGYAISAERGIFFIRPSYEASAEIIERELLAARQAGLLGRNILGSAFSFDMDVHRSAGRYICGEGTAQVNAIMGLRPHPVKGVHMTEQGVWGRPTVVNNVETLACVPHIIKNGPQWFRSLACSKTGSGSKLYCVSGKVKKPGCYELGIGAPLGEIIEEHAGGMVFGHSFKACLTGGASTRYMTGTFYNAAMDFEPLRKIGHRLGTGAIIVYDQNTCLVAATLNLMEFFSRESCGWCTPCREGLPFIRDLLQRIENGEGRVEFIPMLRQMAGYLSRAYCAFAPGAALPLESLIEYFEDEMLEHIAQRACPFT